MMPSTGEPALSSRRPVVALLGNPNTGKTTLFNALAGMRQRVGNYPGVTVETKKGQMTCARPDLRPHRPARHLQPGAPQPRRDGRRRSHPRPAARRAAARRRRVHRRCLQPRPQPLPDDAGAGTGRAGRRRPEHDGRGRGPRAAHRRGTTRASSSACRSCRSRPTRAGAGATRSRRSRRPTAAGGPPYAPASPFPEAFEQEVRQLHDHIGRRRLAVPGAPAAARRGRLHREAAWPSVDHDLPDDVQAARGGWPRPAVRSPAVEARTRYAWIRQATAGCVAAADRCGPSPGPTASTGC